jgi:hypothetical protein
MARSGVIRGSHSKLANCSLRLTEGFDTLGLEETAFA